VIASIVLLDRRFRSSIIGASSIEIVFDVASASFSPSVRGAGDFNETSSEMSSIRTNAMAIF